LLKDKLNLNIIKNREINMAHLYIENLKAFYILLAILFLSDNVYNQANDKIIVDGESKIYCHMF